MVTAKPLGQLIKAGVVASFVTLARHNSESGIMYFPLTHSVSFFLLIYIYIYIYIYIHIYIYKKKERDAVGQLKIYKEKLACSRT